MTNPLLKDSQLPAFSQIHAEQIVPALEQQINENKHFLNELTTNFTSGKLTPSWENIVAPFAEQGDKLSRLWSPVSHMNSVVSNEQFREAHDKCLPMITEYSSQVGQNQQLYNAYQAILEADDLTSLQHKIIEDELLDFKLAGAELNQDDQKRYREIKRRLSELGSQFSNHVLDATTQWYKDIHHITELDGLPESAINTAKTTSPEKTGYRLTLDIPCYLAVMTYANDEALRKEMYRAYCTRASDQSQEQSLLDNAQIIEETLALRFELSQLLGFANYAEYSLATKMAESTEQVMEFLEQLAKVSQQRAAEEFAELTAFAKQIDGVNELNVWDIAYYSEKLRQQEYDISQEELRPWFPENNVLHGLFEITSTLYGVQFNEINDVDSWHEDVRFFNILDSNAKHIGSFYFDLYARAHKRGGAWMDSCRDRSRRQSGELQLPVAYLTCNFNRPDASSDVNSDLNPTQALFTHDEVVTLFHEFGHGLHHLMTEIDQIQVSGINGVSWDAVELPSQFMENFCYHKESLDLIARHVETNEPLSAEVLGKLNDARRFQSAMQMVRQLEFSLFDFRIHLEFDPNKSQQVRTILQQVREQVSVLPPPEWNRFENGFAHIFAGGYAAGYYSYKWAEVLSADIWQSFEEVGIFDKKVSKAFLSEILSQGGSKKAMQLFTNFKGREPSVEPLLKQQGISHL